MTATVASAAEVLPFHIEFPQEALGDLRRRIEATRWPEKETVDDDSQGAPLAMMQALARRWAMATTGGSARRR